MKKSTRFFALVTVLLIFNIKILAQEKSISNSVEVGFNVVDFSIRRYPSPYIDLPIGVTEVNGLFIKKHFENKSYRFGARYTSLAVDSKAKNEHPSDTFNLVGDYSEASLFFGGEKTFYKRKIFEFYWGMDLSFHIEKYTGTAQGILSSAMLNYTMTHNGISVSPFIGARATLGQRLRVSIESKAGTGYHNEKEKIQNGKEMKTEDSTSFDGPLQVYATVSYLF